MKKTLLLLLPILLSAKAVKVDEILTEKNKLKLETSISYANIKKKENVISPITYQTSSGNYVNIPTYLGVSATNQDYINYGFNLKYGINKDFEVFTNLNLFTSDIRISDASFSSKSENDFNSLNIGFTYQIKEEDERASFLVGASTDVMERISFGINNKKDLNFKSYSFFAISYYTVDPIVFLLKASYRLNLEKKDNGQSIESGDIFSISPNIYFAVNPYTSINWGIKYQHEGKDKVNFSVVDNSGSSVGWLIGTSYEFDSQMTLSLDVEKMDTNDYPSDNIYLAISYKF